MSVFRLSKEVRDVKRKARTGGAGRERYTSEPGYTKREEISLEPVHPPRSDFQEREQHAQRSYSYRGEERTERAERGSQYSWEPLPRSVRSGEESRGPRYSYRR